MSRTKYNLSTGVDKLWKMWITRCIGWRSGPPAEPRNGGRRQKTTPANWSPGWSWLLIVLVCGGLGLIRRGISAGTALDMGITNKAFDSYEQGLIRDVIAARIPAKLDRSRLFTD